MKLVIQRVKSASVSVSGETVGKIDKGLFILVGVGIGDILEQAAEFAIKVSKLRIMSDENDKMNLSIKDVSGEVLAVSQFTLYADTKTGNRPSFIKAEEPTKARQIYEYFVETLRKDGISVETGRFGEYMIIETILDGPVTITI
ncbi:MAG: D-aminoacyl-tRNA deacylase [Patescibacteria group bacterium]